MPNKMLIDATHPEETRVVVLRGNRVEEFDFESANRKQLRGNIYLAKVTRVEPSLQAAFVDYGGNRHGFLAFSEIHPDYYQIPVADRQALIDEEERAARAADAEADSRAGRRSRREQGSHRRSERVRSDHSEAHESNGSEPPQDDGVAMTALTEYMAPEAGPPEHGDHAGSHVEPPSVPESERHEESSADHPAHEAGAEPFTDARDAPPVGDLGEPSDAVPATDTAPPIQAEAGEQPEQHTDSESGEHGGRAEHTEGETAEHAVPADHEGNGASEGNGHNITEVDSNGVGGEDEVIESVGGADAMEEVPERTYRSRRQYKIQEVIKRRQVMLVQVVKEERGTKGAALTTYLSLAGRYSVLMPNTARGGGISRKITSSEDRRRLKEIAQDLEVPEGMGVILRTAGAARTKTEVKRDFEYLLRLWETVRDLTLKSTAPTLVYEEGSLVKRSIRDLYNKDIDEILVAGDEGFKDAKEFMRMLMPSHAKNVKPFRDSLPIFTRYGIESQLDAMFQPVVQLRSGGYIVMNQAEALVAIDVNSGRATREHHIEDTALKTNLEAAEEIARQLRLRDLAGLVVIDFIDMDEKRNNRTVERRLKEALKHDRARIQVGHISHFGLLEMSRQRIRSSVLESTTEKCPHCGGMGHVRSVSSVSLQLLRSLEEMLLKGATHNLIVRTRTEIALYLLNHKRAHLRVLEERFQIAIMINADATIGGQVTYVLEKGEQVHSIEQARAIAQQQPAAPAHDTSDDDEEAADVIEDEAADVEDIVEDADAEQAVAETAEADGEHAERAEGEQGERNGRRRRRRRRGRRGEEDRGDEARAAEPRTSVAFAPDQPSEPAMVPSEGEPAEDVAAANGDNGEANGGARGESERRRRRGRRGGRRNRRGQDGESGQPQEGFDADMQAANGHPGDSGPEFGAHDAPAHEPADASLAQTVEASEARSEQPPAWQTSPPAAEPAPAAQHWQPPEPAAPAAEPAPPEHAAPRRRSTVREPAPSSFGETPTAPTPISVSTPEPPAEPPPATVASNAEETQPRRSGWWSRRVFGKG